MTERYRGEESRRISLWFKIETTPAGGAPIEIKQQWIGVPLPMRQRNVGKESQIFPGFVVGRDVNDSLNAGVSDVMDAVQIESEDAIKALRLSGHHGAAEWWDYWFENKPDGYGSTLIFQASEGRFYTPEEVEQEHPGSYRFDSTEI